MKLTLVVAAILVALSQSGGQCPDCPDPDRPWMRGNVEISCARPAIIEKLRRENPSKRIKVCACQHMCNPKNKLTGLDWDARCEARCNPRGCNCPNPCE